VLQDFCSYLRGIMATGAVLEGMGVGRAEATALQATIQWIYRDGASMLGGLLFTSLSSHDFGQNVKQWRLFADAINNVGITLDMAAPYFRRHFLLLICCGSVCKALCGIAAGATGAAIAEHWGEQHGNIADVLAKNNAQHTLVSILGLLFTVRFATFAATASPLLRWGTYLSLTAVHMVTNYQAMRVLALRTINRARYDILLSTLLSCPHWLDSELADSELILKVKDWLRLRTADFSLPAIARKEPIIARRREYALRNVNLWAKPSAVISQLSASAPAARGDFSESDYIILAGHHTTHVCFAANATAVTELQAGMEASLARHLSGGDARLRAQRLTKQLFPVFLEVLRGQGWKVNLPKLRPRGARAYKLLPSVQPATRP
jgi:hypothetical protein